jgi:hypothetical protein
MEGEDRLKEAGNAGGADRSLRSSRQVLRGASHGLFVADGGSA